MKSPIRLLAIAAISLVVAPAMAQEVIGTLAPLEGAKACLDELRSITQVIILSDTFQEFAQPLMRQLAWPTLFCHHLEVTDGRIVNYTLRQPNQKPSTTRRCSARPTKASSSTPPRRSPRSSRSSAPATLMRSCWRP